MISKRIAGRKDGKSSAADALSYGEGLTANRETGELADKSHRTRLGNFGLVDDGVYAGRDISEMAALFKLASIEMQANCDLNTRVGADKKIAHFVISFNQEKPSEAVLRDTEDSMLAAMKLENNHFATFLHNDNGYWHLHLFASRIDTTARHLGNPLWHDKINRDKVCREIEIRHGLTRDNGLHQIDAQGQIVEVPIDERRAKRNAKPTGISDPARKKEAYSGEKSFQTWCAEIRIGDRLKHARTWKDLHAAAAAYGCEVKPKGAGFVICPTGEKGGIQLSKVGLKNLPARFGAFVPSSGQLAQVQPEASYEPAPTRPEGANHYKRWQAAKADFVPFKTQKLNELRDMHTKIRAELRERQKDELQQIRASTKGPARHAAVSVAKMEHVLELAALAPRFADDRQLLRKRLNEEGPGATYRDYLVSEAAKGDNVALGLTRKHGVEEATDVLRKREADQLRIVAVVAGQEYRPAMRLPAIHHIQRNGTVIYDLGGNRVLTDSAISRQVQLNGAAANSPEAVAVALRFSMSKFGNTLTLTGSPDWQRSTVEIAVRNRLPIKFADPALDAYRTSLVQKQTLEKTHASHYHQQQATRRPPPHFRTRLHHLSDGNLVLNTDSNVGVLRQDVSRGLVVGQEDADHRMQRATRRTARTTGAHGAASRVTTTTGEQFRVDGERVRTAGTGGNGLDQPTERIDVSLTPAPIQPNREAEKVPAPEMPAAEQWLADNPTWSVQDDARERSGAVLYVAPDGFWIHKLGRGQAVAIRQPVDFPIQVGDVVDFKNGKATLANRVMDKGPKGPSI